jgi:sorbitol-specific phosphotransferase system component IIC
MSPSQVRDAPPGLPFISPSARTFRFLPEKQTLFLYSTPYFILMAPETIFPSPNHGLIFPFLSVLSGSFKPVYLDLILIFLFL